MKKILVIGGSGFVGFNLIKSLTEKKEYKIFSTIFKKRNLKKLKILNIFVEIYVIKIIAIKLPKKGYCRDVCCIYSWCKSY